MEENVAGASPRKDSPHKGAEDNDGGSPCPHASDPVGSQQDNAHAADMSGTEGMPIPQELAARREAAKFRWHVVLFDKPNQELKFRDFVRSHRDSAKDIMEVYCPTHTVVKEYVYENDDKNTAESKAAESKAALKKAKAGNARPALRERPLFAGSDFVYSTYRGLDSFLRQYYTGGSVQFRKKSVGDRHTEPLTVPERQMEEFRNFNDNYADRVVLLRRPFSDYEYNRKGGQPNETIRIIDGPLAGLTGYLTKIHKNRGLAFQVVNPYGGAPFVFAVTNLVDFHAVRVYNVKRDRRSIASERARAVDLLIGLMQKSGYEDGDIPAELYTWTDRLSRDFSFATVGKELIMQRTRQPADSRLRPTEDLVRSLSNLTDADVDLILNLIRYVKDNPGYVRSNWRHVSLRPFLTPASGIDIPEGSDHAILPHRGFTELICRKTINETTYNPDTRETDTVGSTYYAHVGIRLRPDGRCVAFINWDEFLAAYFATEGDTRKKLVNIVKTEGSADRSCSAGSSADASSSGNPASPADSESGRWKEYGVFSKDAPTLFKVLTGQAVPITAVSGMPVTLASRLNVLATTVPAADVQSGTADTVTAVMIESNQELRRAVRTLIDTGIQICQEISASVHIAFWRNLLSTVWLHK